jgi:hypothetical protein
MMQIYIWLFLQKLNKECDIKQLTTIPGLDNPSPSLLSLQKKVWVLFYTILVSKSSFDLFCGTNAWLLALYTHLLSLGCTQLIARSCKLHGYTHKTQITWSHWLKRNTKTCLCCAEIEASIKIQGMLKIKWEYITCIHLNINWMSQTQNYEENIMTNLMKKANMCRFKN